MERGSIISALVANGILLGGAYGMGRLAQGESTEHSWATENPALNTLFFNLPGGAYSIGKIMARNKNIKEERARMNDQPQPVRH